MDKVSLGGSACGTFDVSAKSSMYDAEAEAKDPAVHQELYVSFDTHPRINMGS